MHFSNHFFILPLIFAIIGTPLAFAQVELNHVDIFCPLEELLVFTGIVPFLEICPINFTVADDLELIKLSPVQAVFDPLKLVDSKTTLLKLDIENTFATTKTAQVTLVIDGAPPIIENVNIIPGTESYYLPSANFIFPTGTDFTASAEIEIIAGETNTANNFDSFTIDVQDTNGVGIIYRPVQLKFDAAPQANCGDVIPISENSEQYITGIYPLDADEYRGFVLCAPLRVTPSDSTDPRFTQQDLTDLFNQLEVFTWFPQIDKVVGIIRDDGFTDNFQGEFGAEGLAGQVIGGTPVFYDAVIIEADNFQGEITAHELYHTFGGGHSFAFGPGFWVDKRAEMGFYDIINEQPVDPMSVPIITFMDSRIQLYRDGNFEVDGIMRVWIQNFQFDDLFETLSVGPFDPVVIGIRGIIFDDDTTLLDPWYSLESDLDVQLGTTGEVSVKYIDVNDQVIGQAGFDLSRQWADSNAINDFGSFALRIPELAGTQKIVLERNGQTLAERIVTSAVPSVTVTSPNGGEFFLQGEPINVSWQSSDPDSTELFYILLISDDGGQTWLPLEADLTDTQFSFNAPVGIDSENVLIRVIATDGVNTSEDVSDSSFIIAESLGELDCSTATPSQDDLWPPNHKMKSITISGITRPDTSPIPITITSIFQDEPTTGSGGDKSPDAEGIGSSTAELRSERLGSGDGRVYHIFFDAIDSSGATCSGEVLVSVPHDQSGPSAVDGGALFDSTT